MAVQAASEKITRLANETITMLREKREKVQKEDGSIAARAVIARIRGATCREPLPELSVSIVYCECSPDAQDTIRTVRRRVVLPPKRTHCRPRHVCAIKGPTYDWGPVALC